MWLRAAALLLLLAFAQLVLCAEDYYKVRTIYLLYFLRYTHVRG